MTQTATETSTGSTRVQDDSALQLTITRVFDAGRDGHGEGWDGAFDDLAAHVSRASL